jgi:hypothetical protein
MSAARQAQSRLFARGGILAIALALTMAGCVSKLAESRVRSALVDAGLPQPIAACMAERMTDRLSIAQLKKLQVLQSPKRSLADYVFAVRRLNDSELLSVTAGSAALCATGLAPERR